MSEETNNELNTLFVAIHMRNMDESSRATLTHCMKMIERGEQCALVTFADEKVSVFVRSASVGTSLVLGEALSHHVTKGFR